MSESPQGSSTSSAHSSTERIPPLPLPPSLLFPYLWTTSTRAPDDQVILGSPPARKRSAPPGLADSDSAEDSDTDASDSKSVLANVDCVVCGDRSSGKHYGQYTCEGCKSFFKRSVRRKLVYTCRGNKHCSIDLHHRNQCQYCRFQKCLTNGMRKEAVQQGRISLFSDAYGARLAELGELVSLPETEQACGVYPGNAMQLASSLMNSHPMLTSSIYYSQLIALLLRAEPSFQKLATGRAKGLELPRGNGKNHDPTVELAARLLFGLVEWARNVPFFPDLQLQDQVLLLRAMWPALFVLTATLHNLPQKMADLSNELANDAKRTELKVLLDGKVERLRELNLDSVEIGCLKGIVLFNPDLTGLNDSAAVEATQMKLYQALDEYERYQHGPSSRTARLLLRLPAVQAVPACLIEQLFFQHLVGRTPIDLILRDMLLYGPPPSQLGSALNSFWPSTAEPSTRQLTTNHLGQTKHAGQAIAAPGHG